MPTSISGTITLDAPLGHINVHIRDGAALLLHANPSYTIYETREGPFELLISLAADGTAFGSVYLDDGESYPPGPSAVVTIRAERYRISITSRGNFHIAQKLEKITILGTQPPSRVSVQTEEVSNWQYFSTQSKLVLSSVDIDLNEPIDLEFLD